MSSHRCILLIEDNRCDIELTQRALEKNRIANDLVVVEDGQDALDYLFGAGPYAQRDATDTPALALLDLKLPRVSGLEVLRRIRSDQRTRRMPVVILTTSREERDLAAAYDGGANSYVAKPVDFHQFQQAIEHLGLYWLVINEAPPQRGDLWRANH